MDHGFVLILLMVQKSCTTPPDILYRYFIPLLYRVFYIAGGARFLNHQCVKQNLKLLFFSTFGVPTMLTLRQSTKSNWLFSTPCLDVLFLNSFSRNFPHTMRVKRRVRCMIFLDKFTVKTLQEKIVVPGNCRCFKSFRIQEPTTTNSNPQQRTYWKGQARGRVFGDGNGRKHVAYSHVF